MDELVGSLQTYEMTLPHTSKSSFMALKTIREGDNESKDNDDDLVFIAKRVRKFFFSIGKRIRTELLGRPRVRSQVARVRSPLSNVMSVKVFVT